MATVTERIEQIEQPDGGYLPLSNFEKIKFEDSVTLNESENVSGNLIGLAVEYMTRFQFGDPEKLPGQLAFKAFEVSLRGAAIAQHYFKQKGALDNIARELLVDFTCAEDISGKIIAACKMVAFDVWYRNPLNGVPNAYKLVNPDPATIENIRIMFERSCKFFTEYSPVVKSGFDFAPYGYTSTVDKGDGDFLSADTLWDMKVYRPTTKIKKDDTLQILMYWVMGQHSGQEIFKSMRKIGIYNPRMNTAYILDMQKVKPEVIQAVENEIICY